LSQPDACPNEVYQILIQCWAKMPTDRPTFEALKDFLMETAPPVVKAVQSFAEENKMVTKTKIEVRNVLLGRSRFDLTIISTAIVNSF
jgi:hypothetical protein